MDTSCEGSSKTEFVIYSLPPKANYIDYIIGNVTEEEREEIAFQLGLSSNSQFSIASLVNDQMRASANGSVTIVAAKVDGEENILGIWGLCNMVPQFVACPLYNLWFIRTKNCAGTSVGITKAIIKAFTKYVESEVARVRLKWGADKTFFNFAPQRQVSFLKRCGFAVETPLKLKMSSDVDADVKDYVCFSIKT